MTATEAIPTTLPLVEAITRLRATWKAECAAARTTLESRGGSVVGPIHHPPTDAELERDYWWYLGMVCALEDLVDELELDVPEVSL